MGQKPSRHPKAEQTAEARGLCRDSSYQGSSTQTMDDDINQETEEDVLSLGRRVRHAKYGTGTIIGKSGTGEDLKIEVSFVNHGRKKMLARFAALEPMVASHQK